MSRNTSHWNEALYVFYNSEISEGCANKAMRCTSHALHSMLQNCRLLHSWFTIHALVFSCNTAFIIHSDVYTMTSLQEKAKKK